MLRIPKLFFVAALVFCSLVQADTRILLEVSGFSAQRGEQVNIALSDKDLANLPQRTIQTQTHWTKGIITFRGPLLRDVLAHVGVSGQYIKARAANDYMIEIPYSDFLENDVILAMSRDGVPMTLRSKGPLWVIYPWSENTSLQQGIYYSRAIWQLVEISSHD
ncbi:MAG: molybdopterin-dependent oxidoreductase [Pseudomonadales bacterium]